MRNIILIFLFFGSSGVVLASHIRAANIFARKDPGDKSGRTFFVTLTVYTDYKNVKDSGLGNQIDMASVKIGFGDWAANQLSGANERTINRSSVSQIVLGHTFENIYETTITLPAAGFGQKIYFFDENRNTPILNIGGGNVEEPIYVETFLYSDIFVGGNSTPIMTVPPIDFANVGQIYTFNPGAYDPDGDSISFKLINPRRNSVEASANYFVPPNMTINPRTGQLTWDRPQIKGLYVIAIEVSEFRNGIRTNYVVRDMQIDVQDNLNKAPILNLPPDSCIFARDLYRADVTAFDPNNDRIEVQLLGGVQLSGGSFQKEFKIPPSTFSADVEWGPGCQNISKFPIQGIVKVTDDFDPPLFTINEWNLQVIGKAPVWLVSETKGTANGIQLSWLSDVCLTEKVKIDIYRKSCDTINMPRSSCLTGVPNAWGFEKIATVSALDLQYLDLASSGRLSTGTNYYYILVAKYGEFNDIESAPSKVVTLSLLNGAPVVSTVSFDKNKLDKEFSFGWYHLDTTQLNTFSRPFSYEIEVSGNKIFQLNSVKAIDTLIHLPLNFDKKLPINFSFKDAQGKIIGSNSAFFLDTIAILGQDKAAQVSWSKQNSWVYADSLQQTLNWFVKSGDTTQVKLNGNENQYLLSGLQNGDSVCSFVEFQYRYCSDAIDSTFSSFSDTKCDLVKDNTAPCPPVLDLKKIDCPNEVKENVLSWIPTINLDCFDDAKGFNLYKQEITDEGDFVKIETLSRNELSFNDKKGEALNCYYITAFDSSGNESLRSNTVCQDFCDNLEFPNVFTPNSDGRNDEFVSNSSFVGYKNSEFIILNRWGKEIYRQEDFKEIKWNGITQNGKLISEGTYYMYFKGDRRTGDKKTVEYKGWLQVVR